MSLKSQSYLLTLLYQSHQSITLVLDLNIEPELDKSTYKISFFSENYLDNSNESKNKVLDTIARIEKFFLNIRH